MAFVKKLIFAPFFLISFIFLLYQLGPILKSYEVIFSISQDTFIQLIILSGLIFLTSFFFVLFATIAFDWKIILPVGLFASIPPIILVSSPLGVILAGGTFISIAVTYLTLENRLKTYISFQPSSLLGPSIKHFTSLLILALSLTYFLSINKIIKEQGFQIPDPLIEQALKLTTQSQEPAGQQTTTPPPSIPQEQIELLKQNPDLLKQYGLDPDVLDTINQPQKTSQPPTELAQNTLKQAVKDQLEVVIKPYLGIIPGVFAILFFFVLQSLIALINLLIYPLLWGIFYILEKTGFVKFTVEQRTIRKMVV